ncbi:MAG: PaREP1 family protein [Candidatus Methanospirareceae archaeon]
MEVTYIILPKRLGEKLREKAEERGYLPEELGVELVRNSLNEELDPEDLVEHYQALSEKYFTEAKEFLSKGDLVQTSEKLWGAASLAVKSVAAKRGLKLEKHGSLWDFVSRLSRESGDRDIIRLFNAANGVHRNFYEDQMNREALEVVAEDIEKLIAKLKQMK